MAQEWQKETIDGLRRVLGFNLGRPRPPPTPTRTKRQRIATVSSAPGCANIIKCVQVRDLSLTTPTPARGGGPAPTGPATAVPSPRPLETITRTSLKIGTHTTHASASRRRSEDGPHLRALCRRCTLPSPPHHRWNLGVNRVEDEESCRIVCCSRRKCNRDGQGRRGGLLRARGRGPRPKHCQRCRQDDDHAPEHSGNYGNKPIP